MVVYTGEAFHVPVQDYIAIDRGKKTDPKALSLLTGSSSDSKLALGMSLRRPLLGKSINNNRKEKGRLIVV